MDQFKAELNLFPGSSANKVNNEGREILYNELKEGNNKALENFTAFYSAYVEQIILHEQERNIPPKATFTELYDVALHALKKFAVTSKDLKDYDRFFAWVVRQSILNNLFNF